MYSMSQNPQSIKTLRADFFHSSLEASWGCPKDSGARQRPSRIRLLKVRTLVFMPVSFVLTGPGLPSILRSSLPYYLITGNFAIARQGILNINEDASRRFMVKSALMKTER